jgi:hypothetical protein
MKANAATGNSEMKINFRRLNDNRHSKPVFVTVGIFDPVSFPVRVRCLRPAKNIPIDVFQGGFTLRGTFRGFMIDENKINGVKNA